MSGVPKQDEGVRESRVEDFADMFMRLECGERERERES
jgi:hypothetical protein